MHYRNEKSYTFLFLSPALRPLCKGFTFLVWENFYAEVHMHVVQHLLNLFSFSTVCIIEMYICEEIGLIYCTTAWSGVTWHSNGVAGLVCASNTASHEVVALIILPHGDNHRISIRFRVIPFASLTNHSKW